jgi:hypothetical protein
MALFFSSSLAMDKFVIGRVEAAIDYSSIQFSIRFAVANRIDDAAEFVLNGLFSAALLIQGCTSRRGGCNWTFVSVGGK